MCSTFVPYHQAQSNLAVTDRHAAQQAPVLSVANNGDFNVLIDTTRLRIVILTEDLVLHLCHNVVYCNFLLRTSCNTVRYLHSLTV